MDAQKTILATAMGVALGGASLTTQAALTSNAVLAFTSGVTTCLYGGTPPHYCNSYAKSIAGSWLAFDYDGNGSFAGSEKWAMTNIGGPLSSHGTGIAIHQTFDNTGNPMGSHAGTINGSESPQFNIWEAAAGVGPHLTTGMHYLTSPMNDLGTDGGGSHLIDMSGWTITWDGIDATPMGGDTANFAGDTGMGLITCSTVSCSASSTFLLVYNATVPLGDPSRLGGVGYQVNIEGSVGNLSSVPVPAAAWLFGSGLLGLIALAKRRKTV